jgi:hypothetical protein
MQPYTTGVRNMRSEAPCVVRLEKTGLSSSTSLWRLCKSSCSSSQNYKIKFGLSHLLGRRILPDHSAKLAVVVKLCDPCILPFDSDGQFQVIVYARDNRQILNQAPKTSRCGYSDKQAKSLLREFNSFGPEAGFEMLWAEFEARQLLVSRRGLMSEREGRTTILSVSSGGRPCKDMTAVDWRIHRRWMIIRQQQQAEHKARDREAFNDSRIMST